MADDPKKKLRLEIAHVLFLDIVGYSKLLTDDQTEVVQQLTDLVRNTEAVREAEAAGQLTRLPTGDGMALVFTGSVEAPVECALQISEALRTQPRLPVRMGIHSGPVNQVDDVNDRTNVAGAGINVAQRVMDCGDAGHILLSKRAADDLAHYRHWQPCLHELGECEVKHATRLFLVNLATDKLGNREIPQKLRAARRSSRRRRAIMAIGVVAVVIALAGLFVRIRRNLPAGPRSAAPGAAISAPSEIPAKSVGVLPFKDSGSDSSNHNFTVGMQAVIFDYLRKIADLNRVIGGDSTIQYEPGVARDLKEIGGELGVAYLLEGNVQFGPGKVRVIVHLIDVDTAAPIWSETYDRDVPDFQVLQGEIAQAVAAKLKARFRMQIERISKMDRLTVWLLLRYTARPRKLS